MKSRRKANTETEGSKQDVTIDQEDEWHLAEACPEHTETHLLDQLDCPLFLLVKQESTKRVQRRRRQRPTNKIFYAESGALIQSTITKNSES